MAGCARCPSSAAFWARLSVDKDLQDKYLRAREHRAHARFERLQELMDRIESGELDPTAARVMIDALKWQCAHEKPNVYGDSLTMRGDKDAPITLQTLAHALDGRVAKRIAPPEE